MPKLNDMQTVALNAFIKGRVAAASFADDGSTVITFDGEHYAIEKNGNAFSITERVYLGKFAPQTLADFLEIDTTPINRNVIKLVKGCKKQCH